MIRNYLGFPRGISGQDLAARAADQALQFGAQIVYTQSVTGLRAEGRDRIVTLSDGSEVTSRTVVLATGVAYHRLAIPALERLVGKGVFYGAVSEARAMRGEEVFVVGAGNSAGQAALHLAEYAAQVTILVRGESLADSMSAYLIDELEVTVECQDPGGNDRGGWSRRAPARGIGAEGPGDRTGGDGRRGSPLRPHRCRATH